MSREFLSGAKIDNLSPVCQYLLLHLRDYLFLPPDFKLGLLFLSFDSFHLLFGLQAFLTFLFELFRTRFLLSPLLLSVCVGSTRYVSSKLRNLLSQLLNVRFIVVLDLGEQRGDNWVLTAEDLWPYLGTYSDTLGRRLVKEVTLKCFI